MTTHAAAAGVGMVAIVILTIASVSSPSLASRLQRSVVDIGIEHQKPLTLSMEVGVQHTGANVEFFSESDETILISVPSNWVRREVKNAPIDTVSAEPPSLGFTRWTLPPRAGISFRLSEAPESLILHNPTEVQMMLNLARVDLPTNTVNKDVILIQGNTQRLW